MAFDPLLILAMNKLPGCRGRLKMRILHEVKDVGALSQAIDLYGALRPERCPSELPKADDLLKTAERELRALGRHSIRFCVIGEPDYPGALAQIADPPLVLYYRGTPDFSGKPAVAIVGTRRPTASGSRQAYGFGLEFGLAGYPVVSGLAFGIDRSAHEGALAGEGATWAVLAGGLDRPSPTSHRRLAFKILDCGGALLGEIPPGGFPEKYAFPRRNRILSGLCRGCIVVQAPQKSGALITADFALDQNRDVYVGSFGMDGSASEGTQWLESQGAPVIHRGADVMADWGQFLAIRTVRNISGPQSPKGLAQMMRNELDGRLFRHMGGWFEYRGA